MKYEYKKDMVDIDWGMSESALDELGRDGWQLVATTLENDDRYYIFIRPLPDEN